MPKEIQEYPLPEKKLSVYELEAKLRNSVPGVFALGATLFGLGLGTFVGHSEEKMTGEARQNQRDEAAFQARTDEKLKKEDGGLTVITRTTFKKGQANCTDGFRADFVTKNPAGQVGEYYACTAVDRDVTLVNKAPKP